MRGGAASGSGAGAPRLAGLSIIIPVLDEAEGIAALLEGLAGLRAAGAEIIVVDGGSRDGTPVLAAPLAERVLRCAPGRARQMNAGARKARGEALLFLHADTVLPEEAADAILAALRTYRWGHFDVALAGRHPMLAVIAAMMNLRSRITGIATGDQAIFIARDTFRVIGGYADIPLMEDIEISRRLKACGPPACLGLRVRTSARRWEARGVWRTIWLMWRLRLAFFLGADPKRLALAYGYRRAAGTEEGRDPGHG